MQLKKIFMTVDDAPSKHLKLKVDFFIKHSIPAVFFCRGEFIEENAASLVYAIQQGFMIGNHSYSHPYFSTISLQQCFDEIIRTDVLIDKCYAQAGIKRPHKVMRFPFGDRGAGAYFAEPRTAEAFHKVMSLQQFLRAHQYVGLNIGMQSSVAYLDVPWTWDSYDYKKRFIQDLPLFEAALQQHWHKEQKEEEILLLHDFDTNHHLFECAMHFLLKQHTRFQPIHIQPTPLITEEKRECSLIGAEVLKNSMIYE